MSCLNKSYRLNNSKDFKRIYKSTKKYHTNSFILFFESNTKLNVAFVTSKKIGIAVVRNSARRRMRAIFLSYQNILLSGKYIFVIKNSINNRSFDELKKDFDFAFNRMRLINS